MTKSTLTPNDLENILPSSKRRTGATAKKIARFVMDKLTQKGVDYSDIKVIFASDQGDHRTFEVGFNKTFNISQAANMGWALKDLGLTEVKRMVNGIQFIWKE